MNVVVGGTSGIGAAVAALLEGPTLVTSRTRGDVRCDVTDRAAIDALVEEVDRLDVLVVSAGLSPSMADARTIFAVDLTGTAAVLDAFEPLVGRGTVVVCVASLAAHLGDFPPETLAVLDRPLDLDALAALTEDPNVAYLLAKRGVLRLVRRLSGPWGARGARVVSVSPGVVDTPMGALEMASGNGAAEIAASCGLGRCGQPDEVAAVIRFLCSDGAAYITGTDVLVDGGAVAAFSA